MFKCKSKSCLKPKSNWLTIDSNSTPSMININNITLICIEDKKVNMKLVDGNTASIDTATPEDAKNVFSAIYTKLHE